jgi:nucleoside-diphosphate-sugar epimerase
MSTALVIGGTGTTGPHVLEGLLDRGYDVTMFHRGVHEPVGLPPVEHVHGDPNDAGSLDRGLSGRSFDLVVAMYGRLRLIADAMRGRCGQFIGISGTVVWENAIEHQVMPRGMKVLASESDPRADTHGVAPRLASAVLKAEHAVLENAAAGHYQGSVLRYPRLYGPHDVVPREWSVIKRIRDGRPHILVPDSGLALHTRCAARNAAHGLLLVIDHPDAANGEDFNIGDGDQYTLGQWVEVVADAAGGKLDVVSVPADMVPRVFRELDAGFEGNLPHVFVDTSKIRHLLGYTDVVRAKEAIGECVAWLERNPPNATDHRGFVDPFDYDWEDRFLAAYQDAAASVMAKVGQ